MGVVAPERPVATDNTISSTKLIVDRGGLSHKVRICLECGDFPPQNFVIHMCIRRENSTRVLLG